MSVSNNVYPNTRAEDERLVVRYQKNFEQGMIRDYDETDIPNNAVFDLDNMRASQAGLSGRSGSFLWSNSELPFYSTFSATMTGDIITSTNDAFADAEVGYKIITNDVDRHSYFISDKIDSNSVRVFGRTVDIAINHPSRSMSIRGPINAHYVDDLTKDSYYLIGNKVYVRRGGETVFSEVFISSASSVFSGTSTFAKVSQFVCLINQNGIFVIDTVSTDNYAWKANEPLPLSRFDSNRLTNTPNPSTYNYGYTYSRIKDTYYKSRYDGVSLIERESPPYLNRKETSTDINATYYSPISSVRPISKSKCIILYANSDYESMPSKTTPEYFRSTSNNGAVFFMYIKFNNTEYKVMFDFTAVYTWSDVAEEIQRQFTGYVSSNIKVINSSYLRPSRYSIDQKYVPSIEIYSINSADTILVYERPSTDDRLSNELDLLDEGSDFQGSPVISFFKETEGKYMYNITSSMYYGDMRSGISNYSIYRSLDIYPHTLPTKELSDKRIVNNPDLLGLVKDIPVCKLSNVTFSADGTFTDYTKTFTMDDVGNVIRIFGSTTSHTITDFVSETGSYTRFKTTLTGSTSTSTIYFGATNKGEFTCSNGVITRVPSSSNDYLELSDVGKLIFWSNGEYSIIKRVLSTTSAEITNGESAFTMKCLWTPTSRVYADSVSDDDLIGYIHEYPMQMQFYDAVPNTNIAAYTNGLMALAKRDDNEVYYSNADDIAKIGYHNSSFQVDSSLQEGIKAIISFNGLFNIMSTINTYQVNVAQSYTGGNSSIGEAYTVLASPSLITAGIGSTHQSKYARGFGSGLVTVTNEPAVRMFDGSKYGDDLSSNRIRRTLLNSMDSMTIIGVDTNSGVHLWGKII